MTDIIDPITPKADDATHPIASTPVVGDVTPPIAREVAVPLAGTNLRFPKSNPLSQLDMTQFTADIEEIREYAKTIPAEDQMAHLNRMVLISNIFRAIGLACAVLAPNPLTWFCLSMYTMMRWVIVGHHTCHGGYDRADNTKHYNRFKFAIGPLRRFMDWFDWFLPEAWNLEHNNYHHFHLGEKSLDPDLVEDNLEIVQKLAIPDLAKRAIVYGVVAPTWRWSYYASNTYKELIIREHEKKTDTVVTKGRDTCMIYKPLFSPRRYWFTFGQFFQKVIGPYFLYQYVALPSIAYIVNPVWGRNLLVNTVCAEILCNIHTFIIIVTNHCGDDVYRFNESYDRTNRGEFYLRQILGSVNYTYGDDLTDIAHGFLNYQIEHHVFPDMSALTYQRIAPMMRAVCEKHRVPYIKESVFLRLQKTVDVSVGKTKMLRA
jgi:fatty acid desaturase